MRTKRTQAVKALVYCAMLAAISVVMARLLSFSVDGGVRWSLDKFPLFLAGMFFGPTMGALTGFVADFTGSLMQFGFNPFLCPPAILYGLFGGLLRRYVQKNPSVIRLGISYLFPIALGSILYQSCALAYFYFKDGPFMEGVIYYLGTRTVQFSIMLVVETFILYMLLKVLLKTNMLTRLGLWPKLNERKSAE
jgi:ECF transporter S component (folate family)